MDSGLPIQPRLLNAGLPAILYFKIRIDFCIFKTYFPTDKLAKFVFGSGNWCSQVQYESCVLKN